MKTLRHILLAAWFVILLSAIASAATFDPVSLDFGAVPGNTITDPVTITFTNNTGGPIKLTDAEILDGQSVCCFGGFTVDNFLFALEDPNDCVVTAEGPDGFNELQDGESCDIEIQFHPTALGARSATLSISYTDEFDNPQVANAALMGEGTAHECDPDLNGTAGNGGQTTENVESPHRVLQRINDTVDCSSVDTVFITESTLELEFGCDVVIIGDLYEWPNIFVADGTLIVNITETTVEIQYLCSSDAIAAKIDIKFCSNPNGFNCKQKGVLPVTIFGSSQLDVTQIDLTTVELCLASDTSTCVSAVDAQFPEDRGDPDTDVGTSQCGEGDVANPDGIDDIDVLFVSREVSELIECSTLSKDETSPSLRIKGNLNDGTPFLSNVVSDIGVDQLLIQTKK